MRLFLRALLVIIIPSHLLYSQSANDYLKAGEQKFNAKDYYGSIYEYSNAITNLSDNDVAYYGRARARFYIKDYSNALRDIEKALDVNPDYIDAYILKGEVLLSEKKYEASLKEFKTALKIDPSNKFAKYKSILLYFLMDDIKTAYDLVEESINEYPDYAPFHYTHGVLLNSKEKFQKAIDEFTKALELGNNIEMFGTYIGRGMAHMAQSEHNSAIEDFNEAIKIEPENSSGYNSRGRIYYMTEDFNNAIKDFNRSVSLNGGSPVIFYNLGMSYYKLEDMPNACKNFQKSCQLGNKNACKKVLLECTETLDDLQ